MHLASVQRVQTNVRSHGLRNWLAVRRENDPFSDTTGSTTRPLHAFSSIQHYLFSLTVLNMHLDALGQS